MVSQESRKTTCCRGSDSIMRKMKRYPWVAGFRLHAEHLPFQLSCSATALRILALRSEIVPGASSRGKHRPFRSSCSARRLAALSVSKGLGMSSETHVPVDMVSPARVQPKRQLTDRLLSLFTEVHSGEGIGALLLGANVFL